jgi:hypothetical protein
MTAPAPDDPPGERPHPPPSDEPSADPARDWERIHALFHEALDLPSADRQGFLEALDARDSATAAEVRSLLSAYEASGDFLAGSPAVLATRGVSPGDKLGPYRIVEEIGRGGMGVVYRATRDDASFTKEVAVKLIDPGMRSDEILKRFRAERQILAMLDHPHIARLIAAKSERVQIRRCSLDDSFTVDDTDSLIQTRCSKHAILAVDLQLPQLVEQWYVG